MRKTVLLAVALSLGSAGCAYVPKPPEPIDYDSSPADMRGCRRLGRLPGPVFTTPGFEAWLNAMRDATVAMGGTDLLLVRKSRDWSVVEGVAYRCRRPLGGRQEVVVSVRG